MDLQRFIFAENLRHLRQRLQQAPAPVRPQIEQMIVAAEREQALYEADARGAHNRWDRDAPDLEGARSQALDWFHSEYGQSSTLASLIDPRPGLMIVDVNTVYAAATGVTPADIAGRPLFVAFPDRVDDPQANGVANLYASLRRVAATGVAESMPVQRYDMRHPDGSGWRERYWRIENRSVTDAEGRLLYLLHLVAEVEAPDGGPAPDGDRSASQNLS